jgi:hypothetical protein
MCIWTSSAADASRAVNSEHGATGGGFTGAAFVVAVDSAHPATPATATRSDVTTQADFMNLHDAPLTMAVDSRERGTEADQHTASTARVENAVNAGARAVAPAVCSPAWIKPKASVFLLARSETHVVCGAQTCLRVGAVLPPRRSRDCLCPISLADGTVAGGEIGVTSG